MDAFFSSLGSQDSIKGHDSIFPALADARMDEQLPAAPEKMKWLPTSTPIRPAYEDSGYFSDANSAGYPSKRSCRSTQNGKLPLHKKLSYSLLERDLFFTECKTREGVNLFSQKVNPQELERYVCQISDAKDSDPADSNYDLDESALKPATDSSSLYDLTFNTESDASAFENDTDVSLSDQVALGNITIIDFHDSDIHLQREKQAAAVPQSGFTLHTPYLLKVQPEQDDKFFSNSELSLQFNLPVQRNEKDVHHIDFVHELVQRNCFSVLSKIFSQLRPSDICVASWVNTEWRKAVISDPNANRLRKRYIKSKRKVRKGPNKENRKSKSASVSANQRPVLCDAQNANRSFGEIKHISNFSSSFSLQAATNISTEENADLQNGATRLQKCPRCNSLSVIQAVELQGTQGNCSSPSCGYKFCGRCLCPYDTPHSCRVALVDNGAQEIGICCKKSKRNLRRLSSFC